jgi:uncharacterized repeat protein (TIGR01451 family)
MKSFCHLVVFLLLLLLTEQTAAQCNGSAGTLVSTGPQTYCLENPATAPSNGDAILEAGDVFQFALYSNPANLAGSLINLNSTGVFSFIPGTTVPGVNYYISAIAGNDNGNGSVDFSDPCLSVSLPKTVIWSNPVVSSTITNVPCFGGNNGAIDITVSGGTGPFYTYTWSMGNFQQDVSNLAPGTYTVTVTDMAGCTETHSATILQPAQITLVFNVQNNNCAGLNNGAINLTVSGGTPLYTYNWSNNVSVEDISGLTAGTYTVTVTDANNCTSTGNTTVGAGSLLNLGIQTYPSCGTNQGFLDLTPSGGVLPYGYDWSNDGAEDPDNDAQDLAAAAGDYTVTVTDANGCTASATASVASAPGIDISGNATPTDCGQAQGTVTATVSSGSPPYVEYLWSNGASNVLSITNLSGGIYCLTVVDAVGCTASACYTVETDCPQIGGRSFIDLNANGLYEATEDSLPFAPVYVYEDLNQDTLPDGPALVNWLTNDNGQFLVELLQSGTYVVGYGQVPGYYFGPGSYKRSADGTEIYLAPVTLNLGESRLDQNGGYIACQISGQLTTTDASCDQPDGVVFVQTSNATAPLNYLWSTAATTAGLNGLFPGMYTVTVTDALGCSLVLQDTVWLGPGNTCATISGQVFADEQINCNYDIGEPGLSGWILSADNGNAVFYGNTDAQGNYNIRVMAGFAYTLKLTPPNTLWMPCVDEYQVPTLSQFENSQGWLFPVQAEEICPNLHVNLAPSLLRRCFDTNYYNVYYENEGTVTAPDAYVDVTLDPFFELTFSPIAYTSLGNNVYRFPLGDIAPGASGAFYFRFKISCDAVLGQTHCTEAHIYPDTICTVPNALWSGASLRLESACDGDSIRFKLRNITPFDMMEAVDYIVVEDGIMFMTAPVDLDGGGELNLAYESNGKSWRMEVPQVAYHPGKSSPSAFVEGCGNAASFSTGFINQFPLNDDDNWIDISCLENVGSYDPNDKQGFPIGYGDQHQIKPGTRIEYLIRFQNTGTDTAFNIVVVDTLSHTLDPLTVVPGASSHPYRFELTGEGVLKFHFENILLPDSFVNEPLSHGYVQFSIYPRSDVPLGTVIDNQAAIYFDYNLPVFTNTTTHKIAENFLLVAIQDPGAPDIRVQVAPNPMTDRSVLWVSGHDEQQPFVLEVYDRWGRRVLQQTIKGRQVPLQAQSWPSGAYAYRLYQSGKFLASGKLVRQ